MASEEGKKEGGKPEGEKKYKIKDGSLLLIEAESPKEEVKPKPPASSGFFTTLLIVTVVFETILIAVFASGNGSAIPDGLYRVEAWPRENCGGFARDVAEIIARERNAALQRAEAQHGGPDERTWRIVSNVLEQVRNQAANRACSEG
jgi:hypothetical protein